MNATDVWRLGPFGGKCQTTKESSVLKILVSASFSWSKSLVQRTVKLRSSSWIKTGWRRLYIPISVELHNTSHAMHWTSILLAEKLVFAQAQNNELPMKSPRKDAAVDVFFKQTVRE